MRTAVLLLALCVLSACEDSSGPAPVPDPIGRWALEMQFAGSGVVIGGSTVRPDSPTDTLHALFWPDGYGYGVWWTYNMTGEIGGQSLAMSVDTTWTRAEGGDTLRTPLHGELTASWKESQYVGVLRWEYIEDGQNKVIATDVKIWKIVENNGRNTAP